MNNLRIKPMKKKYKNLIKITSIFVFSIIVLSCSDDSYNSNIDESTEEEYIEPSNNEQNICPTHNTQLDTYDDGGTYCQQCLFDNEAEANAREEADRANELNNYIKNYECPSCGSRHKEQDENGDLHCMGCGEFIFIE